MFIPLPMIEYVDFGSTGKYSDPELIWNTPIAPTAIKFYNSEKMGIDYKNDLFVVDANTGSNYLLKIDWLFY